MNPNKQTLKFLFIFVIFLGNKQMLIENWKGEREKRVCRSDILFARK